MRALKRGVAFVAAMMAPALAWAQGQQDGFLPVDPATDLVESLPAAPMVMTAYGLVWLVLMAYVWSLRRRQARVELEMAALRARVNERPLDTDAPRP
jgi:CcmD family protein